MATDLRDQLQSTLSGTHTIERELGGGGMSRVFVAEEQRLKRKVVVKVLSPELAQGISAERFEREIQVAASLQQANIVPVLSVGETDGLPYYTMPFVSGESLRHRLGRTGALSVPEAVNVLRDVARALAYAHEQGIVHRDIKPDNVLLSGGAAVVTDFGIAKALSASRKESDSVTLTQMGTSIGTPAYISPEQAAGDPDVDHRADIYSFGCMAYELLTGRPPFIDKTPQRLMAAHMGTAPQPVSELRPDIPAPLAALVMRCLEKDAAARPQSAAELLSGLDSASSSTGTPAMPAILLGGRGMLKKAIATYAVAFVLVAIVAKAAIVGIGLPDWVFPGALVVMALGLPAILFTAYTQYVTRRAMTVTPTFTPGGTPSLAHGTMATLAFKASPHLSWRRTGLGGAYAIGAFVLVVGGFMLLRSLGIGPAGSLFAEGKLKQNEQIVVADFDVKAGVDTALRAVAAEAVRTDLGESNALSVVPASTIRAALQRMQKPVGSRLDSALAQDLAQREGIRAVVEGSLSPLGSGFLVTARIVVAATGDELASRHETAAGPADLVSTIDKVTRELRGKIGESLKNVQASPPLAKVTTASLDALKKYQEGANAEDLDYNHPKAVQLLKEAVAMDTAFAMAWRKLAVVYSNGRYPASMTNDAAERAYRFRDRLTDNERDNAIGVYFQSGAGRDRAKAAAAYEALVQRGELNAAAINLGVIYTQRRELARADTITRRVIARGIAAGGTATLTAYDNLVEVLADERKPTAAESVSTEISRLFPNAQSTAANERSLLQYDRGELDSARRGWEGRKSVGQLGNLSLLQGRLAEAASDHAAAGAAAASARGTAFDSLGDALWYARLESWQRQQPARGTQLLDQALARWPIESKPVEDRPYLTVATDYARAGRPDRARAVLSKFQSEVHDTSLLRFDAPELHGVQAEIALAEKRPLDAINEFRLADQLPDGPVAGGPLSLYANLGRAFDQANQPDSAIAYFERFLSTTVYGRVAVDATFAAGIQKRLGELYEAKGQRQLAIVHYTKFVELWKNADPELQPQVDDVRKRLARLGNSGG